MKKSTWSKFLSIGSTVLLVLAVCICVFVLAQVFSKGHVSIAGKSLFRVATGSMEPSIQVGALLIAEETDIDTIAVGDIICFKSQEPYQLGQNITHRVMDIWKDMNGNTLLQTKGDANLTMDRLPVSADNLVGKVTWYSQEGDLMATIVSVLTDRIGFLACILFPCLLICGFVLQHCVNNIRKEMSAAIAELEQRVEKTENSLFTQEEYAAMMERIRKELLEEFKQGATNENSELQIQEKTE